MWTLDHLNNLLYAYSSLRFFRLAKFNWTHMDTEFCYCHSWKKPLATTQWHFCEKKKSVSLNIFYNDDCRHHSLDYTE